MKKIKSINKTSSDSIIVDGARDVEKDIRIGYSEFLSNQPICLILFNDGYHCAFKTDTGIKTHQIGDGSIHDAYARCSVCPLIRSLKNILKNIKGNENKKIPLRMPHCNRGGRLGKDGDELWCQDTRGFLHIDRCKELECRYFKINIVNIKLKNILEEVRI